MAYFPTYVGQDAAAVVLFLGDAFACSLSRVGLSAVRNGLGVCAFISQRSAVALSTRAEPELRESGGIPFARVI